MKKSSKIISVLLMGILGVSCSTPSQQQVDPNKVPNNQSIERPEELPEEQEVIEEPVISELPEIIFEKLDTAEKLNKNKLYEIQDQEILRQLIELFPDSQTYIDSTYEKNEDVFQAIIPLEVNYSVEKEILGLMKSENVSPDTVKKYAVIFNSDFSKITDTAKYFTDVNTYYRLALKLALTFIFDDVNTEIDSMKEDVQSVKEYQEREFKSIMMTSYSRIKEISKFKSEIVDKEEVRSRNLENLEHLKTDVIQQINQVNLAMTDTLGSELSDFKEYIVIIKDETILIEYQSILINMLGEISKLMSVLSKGDLSDELSFSAYNEYIESTNAARAELSRWHDVQFDEFGVDLLNKKVNKEGVSAIVSYIPGVFNRDWRKKQLDDEFIEEIKVQTIETAFVAKNPRELSGENVKIVIMEGKVYYMYP
jgi:hypothetical protein